MSLSAIFECPKTRRSFRNCWGAMGQYCEKARYYLHVLGSTYRARRFTLHIQIERRSVCRRTGSIIGYTARALVSECNGHWRQAAKYRLNEARTILRLDDDCSKSDYMLDSRKGFLVGYSKSELRSIYLEMFETEPSSRNPMSIASSRYIPSGFAELLLRKGLFFPACLEVDRAPISKP